MSKTTIPGQLRAAALDGTLVPFVGAGVTRNAVMPNGCTTPPADWNHAIQKLAEGLSLDSDPEFNKLFADGQGDLLEAAEYLRYMAREAARINDIDTILYDCIQRPNSTSKRYKKSEWHDAIISIGGDRGPRVIVTTNYDSLLEDAGTEGFTPVSYDSGNLLAALDPTSAKFPIFKLHGSFTNKSAPLILSTSDYQNLECSGRHMLETIRSLLMTRTALFVGYSIKDPDLRPLLRSVVTSGNTAPRHYMLTSEDIPSHKVDYLRNCFGVLTLRYSLDESGGHSNGLKLLQQLGPDLIA